jgi:uncharacterized membrane protein HdeD (DUF308 family)
MIVGAVSALVAFFTGFENVSSSSNEQLLVELWRLFGFIVFSGIFALLALRPKQYAGIWEIAIFHKLAMSISAIVLIPNVEGAFYVAIVDGILVILLIAAYLLTGSYTSWKVFTKDKSNNRTLSI